MGNVICERCKKNKAEYIDPFSEQTKVCDDCLREVFVGDMYDKAIKVIDKRGLRLK
jgi:hypothetical protein